MKRDKEEGDSRLFDPCDFVTFERAQIVFGSLSLPEESGRWERISSGGRESRWTFNFSKTLLAPNGAIPVAKKLFCIVGVLKALILASAISSRKSSLSIQ